MTWISDHKNQQKKVWWEWHNSFLPSCPHEYGHFWPFFTIHNIDFILNVLWCSNNLMKKFLSIELSILKFNEKKNWYSSELIKISIKKKQMANTNWNSFLRMTFSSLIKLWILELKNSLRWFSVLIQTFVHPRKSRKYVSSAFFFSLKLDQKLSSLLVEIAGLIFMAFFDGKSFDRVFSQMETYFQDGSASHF